MKRSIWIGIILSFISAVFFFGSPVLNAIIFGGAIRIEDVPLPRHSHEIHLFRDIGEIFKTDEFFSRCSVEEAQFLKWVQQLELSSNSLSEDYVQPLDAGEGFEEIASWWTPPNPNEIFSGSYRRWHIRATYSDGTLFIRGN